MDQDEKNTRRLDNVEMALSHLQNDYEALNETLLLFSNRFEQLRAHLEQLETRIKSTSEPTTPKSIDEEKPPHY